MTTRVRTLALVAAVGLLLRIPSDAGALDYLGKPSPAMVRDLVDVVLAQPSATWKIYRYETTPDLLGFVIEGTWKNPPFETQFDSGRWTRTIAVTIHDWRRAEPPDVNRPIPHNPPADRDP